MKGIRKTINQFYYHKWYLSKYVLYFNLLNNIHINILNFKGIIHEVTIWKKMYNLTLFFKELGEKRAEGSLIELNFVVDNFEYSNNFANLRKLRHRLF